MFSLLQQSKILKIAAGAVILFSSFKCLIRDRKLNSGNFSIPESRMASNSISDRHGLEEYRIKVLAEGYARVEGDIMEANCSCTLVVGKKYNGSLDIY